jgi:hypothetical protein
MTPADEQEIRAELIGAPPALRDLQGKAQQVHETLLDEELEVVYEHAGVIGTWRRGSRIDGAGPMPAYYYDFKGSVVVSWTGA